MGAWENLTKDQRNIVQAALDDASFSLFKVPEEEREWAHIRQQEIDEICKALDAEDETCKRAEAIYEVVMNELLEAEDLAGFVHDLADEEATYANDGGVLDQTLFIAKRLTIDEFKAAWEK